MHQLWEVEPKLVPVALGVRALDFAQFALKARVHDGTRLGGSYLPDIAVILFVQKRKKRRERIAVLEAEPAAVAYLERSLDLLVERTRFPVLLFGGIVGQSIRWFVADVLFVCCH